MALPSSGSLSLSQIEGEFGGSGAKSLSEYYSAHSSVPSIGNAISISDFYGLSDNVSFSFVIQGAGGAGGWGLSDGGSGTYSASGGSTSISGSGMSTQTVAGGAGGQNAVSLWYDNSNRNGQASFYGAGGAGGANNAPSPGQDAPSSSYGAGGGGGGSDAENRRFGIQYDNDGAGGIGGGAGARSTGSATVPSGTTITITVGAGGVGTQVSGSQGRAGGSGASGYATVTYNGVTTTYTAGTHTRTLN